MLATFNSYQVSFYIKDLNFIVQHRDNLNLVLKLKLKSIEMINFNKLTLYLIYNRNIYNDIHILQHKCT